MTLKIFHRVMFEVWLMAVFFGRGEACKSAETCDASTFKQVKIQ